MKRFAPLLLGMFALGCLTSCGTVKDGVKWTYSKTKAGVTGAAGVVTGAGGYVMKGAKKLWPWGGKKDEKTVSVPKAQSPPDPNKAPKDLVANQSSVTNAPKAPKPAAPPDDSEPSVLQIPKGSRYVTDTLLGADKREETNAAVPLPEGWEVQGAKVAFKSAYPSDPASLLRAEGRPARALKNADGKSLVAQAREIHFRADTGILTLKGFPALQIGRQKITAAGANTEILLHLATGSFRSDGQVNTTSD